jgi:hypothetical protein
MDGLEGALRRQSLAHFFQCQVGFAGQQLPQLLLVALNQFWLGAGETVTGPQVAGVAALLEKFLDQTKGYPEAPGHLLPRALLLIIGSQDAFA